MNTVDLAQVRAVIVAYLNDKSLGAANFCCDDLGDDCDLLLSGLIDSIGFLELVGTFQETFGEHIDLDDLADHEMTVVGPLCRFVAEQASSGP